ncbi:MAG TPA: DUF1330 domain-containing protein [Paracoccaceae bacterium]|nr:DUF1330 domain-containing protein [Paracoccaceae bacterium]
MPAYIIADTEITDPVAYDEYKAKARPLAEKWGGEYLARGGRLAVDDADRWTPVRLVLIRFPSFEAAEAFLASEDYAPLKALRRANAKSTLVVVEGL